MGFFSGTIAAFAEGRNPHAALLAEHEFNDATAYNWTGLGHLVLYGHTWVGLGEIVKMTNLGFGADDAAQAFTMTLSGVNSAAVKEARTMPTLRGRSQKIWLQFFDPDDLQPIDDRYLIAQRVMDVMSFKRAGSISHEISLTSEDIWTGLNSSEHASWSKADQQALFPGDTGCDFTAELQPGTRVKWPDFSSSG